MRTIAQLLVLLLAVSPSLAAPAPLPKAKPKPKVVREFWEIDFSPLAKAGMVNLQIQLSVLGVGEKRVMSVGQVGQVHVGAIVDAFKGHFQRGEVVVAAKKTKLILKSLSGRSVTGVQVVLGGLDKKFSPVALPPTKKK
jgi:hypothetical protein